MFLPTDMQTSASANAYTTLLYNPNFYLGFPLLAFMS